MGKEAHSRARVESPWQDLGRDAKLVSQGKVLVKWQFSQGPLKLTCAPVLKRV